MKGSDELGFNRNFKVKFLSVILLIGSNEALIRGRRLLQGASLGALAKLLMKDVITLELLTELEETKAQETAISTWWNLCTLKIDGDGGD